MVLPINVRCLAMAVVLATNAIAQQQLTEGQQLRAQGHYLEARDVFAALLRTTEKTKPNSRTVALILDNKAVNDGYLNDCAEAENGFNRALSILDASNDDDPLVAVVKSHLAELYLMERRPREAEALLRRASTSLSRAGAQQDGVDLAIVNGDLAIAFAMQGRKPQAETVLRQTLPVLEAQLGPDDPRLIVILSPLSALLLSEHRYSDALAPAERAWHILQSTPLTIDAANRASVSDLLGEVYDRLGRTLDAESRMKEAINLMENVYRPSEILLARYLTHYGQILKRLDRKKEAREAQKRATTILAHNTRTPGGYTVSASALR